MIVTFGGDQLEPIKEMTDEVVIDDQQIDKLIDDILQLKEQDSLDDGINIPADQADLQPPVINHESMKDLLSAKVVPIDEDELIAAKAMLDR